MTYPNEDTFGPIVPNATDAWMWLLQDVMTSGQSVSVRGRNITELLHRTQIIDMNQPIVSIKQRKLGYAFLFAEAAWILSGRNDVASISPFSKAISNFSDDGVFFRGAYGPQIVQQLPYVIETLRNDIFSRQAVISIWKPSPMPSKDIPCTVTVQFMVRGGFLHAFVDMRSSDCWLGVPYDWFNFSMLARYLLLLLKQPIPGDIQYGSLIDFQNIQLGHLYFKANSQHIYEDDIPKVTNVLQDDTFDDVGRSNEWLVAANTSPEHFVSNLWKMANAILAGESASLEY